MSTVDITPIRPVKFTYGEVDDFIDNNYPRTDISDTDVRAIVKELNKRTFADAIERTTALDDLVRAAIPPEPKISDALRRLRELTPPDNLVIDLDAEERHPWLESGRPGWSDPSYDRLGRDDNGATTRATTTWQSEVFETPCLNYCGKTSGGLHRLPKLRSALKQCVSEGAPYIQILRENWYRSSGEKVPSEHRMSLQLDLTEAVTLAHVLLNLVDLANEGQASQAD